MQVEHDRVVSLHMELLGVEGGQPMDRNVSDTSDIRAISKSKVTTRGGARRAAKTDLDGEAAWGANVKVWVDRGGGETSQTI